MATSTIVIDVSLGRSAKLLLKTCEVIAEVAKHAKDKKQVEKLKRIAAGILDEFHRMKTTQTNRRIRY